MTAVDRSKLHGENRFIQKHLEDCNYPIYLEKDLENLWGKTKIDVAGWAAFKRLVLLEA